MPNENKLIVRSNIIVLVIVAVIGMMLFFVNDPYGLKLILLLACIIWAKTFAFLNRTGIDRIVFLLWVYDIILCFTSINTFASVRVVRNSTALYFAYLLLRQVMEYPKSVRLLKQSICIVMGVALLLSLLSFFIFRRSVLDAGFEDTYSFRFLFLPLGHNTNEWTTVLLGFAGLSLVFHRSGNTGVRWLTYVLLTLSWVATWLSFSRGGFYGFWNSYSFTIGRSSADKREMEVVGCRTVECRYGQLVLFQRGDDYTEHEQDGLSASKYAGTYECHMFGFECLSASSLVWRRNGELYTGYGQGVESGYNTGLYNFCS